MRYLRSVRIHSFTLPYFSPRFIYSLLLHVINGKAALFLHGVRNGGLVAGHGASGTF